MTKIATERGTFQRSIRSTSGSMPTASRMARKRMKRILLKAATSHTSAAAPSRYATARPSMRRV